MGLETVQDADECFNRVFDCNEEISKCAGHLFTCSHITAVHYIKEHVHVISNHRSPILLHVSLTKFITLICY